MQQGALVSVKQMKEESKRKIQADLDRLKRIKRAKVSARQKALKIAAEKAERELEASLKIYNPSSRFTTEEALERIMANIRNNVPAFTDKIGDDENHVHVFRWNDGTQVPVKDVVYVKVQAGVSVQK